MMPPPSEARGALAQLTRQAVADVLIRRIDLSKRKLKEVAEDADVCRAHLRNILRRKSGLSLGVFLRLSDAMGVDPCELLRAVVSRRDVLREQPLNKR